MNRLIDIIRSNNNKSIVFINSKIILKKLIKKLE